jgi:hypothetical protein
MKLIPYKDLLKLTKEKIDSTLAPIRANQAKKQCELEIAVVEEKIATLESDIQELCSKHPLEIRAVADKLDQLALQERYKKQITKVIDELFADPE